MMKSFRNKLVLFSTGFSSISSKKYLFSHFEPFCDYGCIKVIFLGSPFPPILQQFQKYSATLLLRLLAFVEVWLALLLRVRPRKILRNIFSNSVFEQWTYDRKKYWLSLRFCVCVSVCFYSWIRPRIIAVLDHNVTHILTQFCKV